MRNEEVEIKPIPGFEGYYSATSDGRIISEERFVTGQRYGKPLVQKVKSLVLKPVMNSRGYLTVSLCKDGVRSNGVVHRVIAKTFLPPPVEGQTVVRHKEGNVMLNGKDDLEWGTHTDNNRDKIRHGTSLRGIKNPNSKLSPGKVTVIKNMIGNDFNKKAIANELGVHWSTVYKVAKGEIWG